MKKRRNKIIGAQLCSIGLRRLTAFTIEHANSGLSNREILRRYIWPLFYISEKTFYNLINASADPRIILQQDELNRQLSLF